jgi:Flp pilus assembly protein TadD
MRWILCIGPIALALICTPPDILVAVVTPEQEAEPTRFREAEVRRQAGELARARDLYGDVIREHPDFAPAYRSLGETLLRLGESREAVGVLEQAVRRFGDQVHLLLLLGVAYGPEGRIADSVRTLKRLVEVDPESPLAWANLGVSLEQMGEPAEARKAFEKALDLGPSSLFARNRLGRLLLMTGDVAAARKHLERSLELDAGSTDARYYLSQALRAEGRPAEADGLFHEAFGLPAPTVAVSPGILARGKALTRVHCTTCHPEPRPESLPKRMWPFISVWMGNYLGFRNVSEPFANLVVRTRIPDRLLIGREDFHAIHHYLVDAAPSEPLPPPEKPPVTNSMPWFRVSALTADQTDSAWITLVSIDSNTRRLFVGEAYPSGLAIFDRNRELLRRVPLPSQPVAVQTRDGGFDLTLIGDFDVDRRRGGVLRFEEGGKALASRSALRDYFRTSHSRFVDLTGDGREDLVVCGFGEFDRGRFAWFENLGDGGYREHVLLERAGALRVEVEDFTRDGRRDLLVLFAQGRQELILFENLGDRRFQARTLLEQFPGFGYNDFLIADFNGDGHSDLVTVNGNNMEFDDPPLRGYHGIRVYLNDGRMKFTEKYFYPMFGALRAVAGDFTGDGTLDVAAVSYFPDWTAERPETFVLLAHQGGLRFRPYTLEEARWGRWLALHAGDLTGDGRLDLVLGNAPQVRGIPPARQPTFRDRSRDVPPVLILEQRIPPDGAGHENGVGPGSTPSARLSIDMGGGMEY